jgi:hypothetical protein
MGTQYAFFNRLRFDEKETFHHFGFTHTPEEEQAATQKGIELLKKSPYQDKLGNAQLFLRALNDRLREIPNLVSPHVGNGVATVLTRTSAAPGEPASEAKPGAGAIAALPLGGRIRVEPWNNQLQMMKSKPTVAMAEDEVTPFELTPFMLYLTREGDNAPAEVPGAVAVKATADTKIPDPKP